MKWPPIFRVDVTNFVVITYSVPADRVMAHLPEHYELDTYEGLGGPRAFVSTTSFCNTDFRAALLPYPRHTFNESTYRTYVTKHGDKGIYFFGRYLGTKASWAFQRPIARHTYKGDFQLAIENQEGTFPTYECNVTSSEGDTRFSVRASRRPQAKHPFESSYEFTQFLTYRLHGFYTNTGGFQGHMPVEHPRMDPVEGELLAGKFDLWNRLGIVHPDEIPIPHSVLVTKTVPFTLYASRPVRRSG